MDNLITTTELQERYGSTAGNIISKLKEKGFKPTDVVIGSHHMWGWEEDAVQWLDKHFEKIRSTKVLLEDYAKELDIDIKSFKEILYTLHITAIVQTERNPVIEKAVAEYKKQEQMSINKTEHPLVTDERCFKLAWFPDVVPKCFEDLDSDRCGSW